MKYLLEELELLIEITDSCTSENRVLKYENMAHQIISYLEKKGECSAKFLLLKSKHRFLGEVEALSDNEYEKKWIKLVRKSAKKGDKEAEYELACKYYDSGDFSEALHLYEKSSQKGYAPSLWCYGLDLYQGVHISKDVEKGLFYIHISAEMGYEYARDFLINFYSDSKNKFVLSGSQQIEKFKLLEKWES